MVSSAKQLICLIAAAVMMCIIVGMGRASGQGRIPENQGLAFPGDDLRILKAKVRDLEVAREGLAAQLKTQSKGLLPIGSIIPYYGLPADLPPNWVICDNRQLDARYCEPGLYRRMSGCAPDLTGRTVMGARSPAQLGRQDSQESETIRHEVDCEDLELSVDYGAINLAHSHVFSSETGFIFGEYDPSPGPTDDITNQ